MPVGLAHVRAQPLVHGIVLVVANQTANHRTASVALVPPWRFLENKNKNKNKTKTKTKTMREKKNEKVKCVFLVSSVRSVRCDCYFVVVVFFFISDDYIAMVV